MEPAQQPYQYSQQQYMQQHPLQQPQIAKKPFPVPGILLICFKLIIVTIVAIIGGTFFETIAQDFLVFDPQALLTIWVISFFISLILKINYTSKLYVISMIVGTLLTAYYPFSQALIITFLLLFLGKLVRLM